MKTTTQPAQTNAAHTPGPWAEYDGFIVGRFADGHIHDICDPRCAPSELFAEIDANTYLILAAPDLLAALGAALAVIERHPDADVAMGPVAGKCRTAIAKAKGVQS
jgi:hypothetical protein